MKVKKLPEGVLSDKDRRALSATDVFPKERPLNPPIMDGPTEAPRRTVRGYATFHRTSADVPRGRDVTPLQMGDPARRRPRTPEELAAWNAEARRRAEEGRVKRPWEL